MTAWRPSHSAHGSASTLSLIAAAVRTGTALEMKFPNAQVEPLSFAKLDGWKADDHAAAFATFMKSCGAILQGTKAHARGPAGLWRALQSLRARQRRGHSTASRRAPSSRTISSRCASCRRCNYGDYTGADGFFTGYYEAEVDRLARQKRANTRFRSTAFAGEELRAKGARVFSQYDRTEIEKGALAGKGLEICWMKNPVDAFFAQIQGSTRVKLDDGKLLRLNYIASNGKPYTPVGRLHDRRGHVTPEDMSMDKIREYMEANPDEGKTLREKNRSFVFFSETRLEPNDEPLGAQGIPLTPRRSLAVDPSMHVYGTPIWIDAKFPLDQRPAEDTFQHLVVAQDTGSAIGGRGARRHLFRPRRGVPPCRRPHQAVRQVRHAGAAGRRSGRGQRRN